MSEILLTTLLPGFFLGSVQLDEVEKVNLMSSFADILE